MSGSYARPRARVGYASMTRFAERTQQEIIRNKYPLKSNDKIESPADFFIYRKSPASGSDSEAN